MSKTVAIFGKIMNERIAALTGAMCAFLRGRADVLLYRPLSDYLVAQGVAAPVAGVFTSHDDLPPLDCFFSIGGDGTFLESVRFVRDSGTIIAGINVGRLGFLASITEADWQSAVERLLADSLPVEDRTLLHVESKALTDDFPYALNEMVVQKRTGLLTVHAWCNDEALNTYWADGLIIATPTGSTAYSMSVGGPIVAPESRSLILSPIAPHHLTVRPLVIADNAVLRLKPESRLETFTLSLDSRNFDCPSDCEITIRRAEFTIRTVKPCSFYNTLRNKLMWGEDKRN